MIPGRTRSNHESGWPRTPPELARCTNGTGPRARSTAPTVSRKRAIWFRVKSTPAGVSEIGRCENTPLSRTPGVASIRPANAGAAAGSQPIRRMPVSTLRCRSASTPRADAAAAASAIDSASTTQSVILAPTAAHTSSPRATDSLRMGSPTPASRSSSASLTVATPSQSAAPVRSIIRLTATAPCP